MRRIWLFSVILWITAGTDVCYSAGAVITHGPILGRLSPDGIGIWVRTSRPAEFRAILTPVEGGPAVTAQGQTHLDRDMSGWVHVTGLQPNAAYTYIVDIPESQYTAEGGRFTTLPHADQFRNADHNPLGLFNFSFEFACGNNQGPASAGPAAPAFRTMLQQLHGRIHFEIMNGDWLYEDLRETTPEEWRLANAVPEADMPRTLRIAPTLAGVWENYKAYLARSATLSAWHRNIPTFFTFDDHEMLNDVWGAGSPGLRDRRATFRDIGIEAWRHYLGWSNPLPDPQPQGIHFGNARFTAGRDVLEDPEADFTQLDLGKAATLLVHWGGPTAGVNENALDGVGGHPAAGVYAIEEILGPHRLRISPPPKADGRDLAYSIGMQNHFQLQVGNCGFFLLDTRTHREMHDTQNPGKPGLSMIGQRQKQWLMNEMRRSDADFLFVVSSVNFMIPHVGGGVVRADNKDDAWTVFLDERKQLIDFWDSLGKPVFVLTGDLHNSFVIQITDRVWEFASGPHNSQNHLHTDEGNRAPNGPFTYNNVPVDVRWSTFWLGDMRRSQLKFPHYCVVQVNNVINNPKPTGEDRWVAFPRPQVVFQYFDGLTGKLQYAEAITATGK